MNSTNPHSLGRMVLYGAGGHAAVVAAAVIRAAEEEIVAVLDDGLPAGAPFMRWIIDGDREALDQLHTEMVTRAHIAIGANGAREQVAQYLAAHGFELVTVRHPAAIVEEGALIEPGTFLAAQALVGARSRVGTGCIINTAASIDHDCRVAPWSHVCPGVRLAGNVTVGTRAMIGTGAVVIPGISIGSDAVVGAGAVVIHDVADGMKVVGNPARPLGRRDNR